MKTNQQLVTEFTDAQATLATANEAVRKAQQAQRAARKTYNEAQTALAQSALVAAGKPAK